MDLRQLPASPAPGEVNLVVEIPAGSRNKYEYNAEAGVMVLDRVLHSSVRYPFDYGFVPNTFAEDGAPLDGMVIMDESTFPGCLIRARPIGVLDLLHGGCRDGKLLCVPIADQRKQHVVSIRQISPTQLADVKEFFRTYRSLDGQSTTILGWLDQESVPALLERCIAAAAADRPVASGGPPPGPPP
jgi:inorganic pyrophosphatase